MARLVVGPRVGLARHQGEGRGVVPHRVHPVAEVRAVLHRQREEAHGTHGRQGQAEVLAGDVEVDQFEREVVVRGGHADQRLVGDELETDAQNVPLERHAVGAEGGLLVREGELDLVLERPVLRDGEGGELFGDVEHLLARRLHDE